MKFGRKRARHTLRSMRSALAMAKALNTLGAPPAASNDYIGKVTVDWGMLGNDEYGNCVWADTGHSLMLRTANTGEIVVPTTEQVLAAYSAHTGFNPADPSTDQGDDETSTCQYLEQTGFLGHKSDATGAVDPANLDHVKWCVQLFGACRLGLNFPAWAMDAFNAGQPWGAPPAGADVTIAGGHDVPLFGYDGNTFQCVTWGRLQAVTPEFMSLYCEEAHSELYGDWVAAQGTAPSGFDMATLIADLAAIGETEPMPVDTAPGLVPKPVGRLEPHEDDVRNFMAAHRKFVPDFPLVYHDAKNIMVHLIGQQK